MVSVRPARIVSLEWMMIKYESSYPPEWSVEELEELEDDYDEIPRFLHPDPVV